LKKQFNFTSLMVKSGTTYIMVKTHNNYNFNQQQEDKKNYINIIY